MITLPVSVDIWDGLENRKPQQIDLGVEGPEDWSLATTEGIKTSDKSEGQ